MIPRRVEIAFGVIIAAIVTVTPFLYQSYQNRVFRNVRIVKDGVLYRSGQLPPEGLKRLIHDYRIKTIVCLRDGEKQNDQIEEAYARANGIRFVRVMPRRWLRDESGSAPVEIGLAQFREVMADPSHYPVLLHCYAGTHRTGAYTAVYRMDFEGWSNEKAMNELRGLGYDTLDEDEDVCEFLATYQPKMSPPFRVTGRVSP